MSDFLLDDDGELGTRSAVPADHSLERMWPLDVALAALGGLVIYTVATRLDASDPRILYNPLTYAVLVPAGVVGLSLLLRNVASRFVRRSMQLGFLLSVLVHLMLLIVFFNVMILAPFWPHTEQGNEPTRMPPRKTVPDSLFARRDVAEPQPDWARPVDAQTRARAVPTIERPPDPVESTRPRLELPTEQPRLEVEVQPTLERQPLPPAALPTPESSAGGLTRERMDRRPDVRRSLEVPEVAAAAAARATATVREVSPASRSESSPRGASVPVMTQPVAPQLPTYRPEVTAPAPRRVERRPASQPRVGQLALESPRPPSRRSAESAVPAGAAPAVPTYRAAREQPNALRMLDQRATNIESTSRTSGAALDAVAAAEGPTFAPAERAGAAPAPTARYDRAQAGLPNLSGDVTDLAEPGRRPVRGLDGLPAGTLGGPDVAALAMNAGSESQERGRAVAPTDALDRLARSEGERAGNGTAARSEAGAQLGPIDRRVGAVDLPLRVPGEMGGLSRVPRRTPGLTGDASLPDVSTLDFGPRVRRRDLGGPVAPAGREVAGVQPFDRRTQRTSGGTPPAPIGMIGPETEEAIELGLAYLAEQQNENGSWSLQGHGEAVLMRSDTAATGLCLLAFQGAGYTHKEHQYADTVARGIDFLVRTQRTNGDLYQRENQISDRNAWLYSHGIAALALCEAYGMTRDPELRGPAQKSLDFIGLSQDPQDGGWRYQPRRGSDTSVTGWMMMALKSGELSGLEVPEGTYRGIRRWLQLAQESPDAAGRYRYNPRARDDEVQGHGLRVSHTMTAVGLLARLYLGWQRERGEMQEGADYLADRLPRVGSVQDNERDTYYWYYATQVMFHMGGDHWERWNSKLKPILISSQVREGPVAGSWDPLQPVPDRWARYAGRVYVTTMNLLSLEVYYRHLPIYEETGR